MKILTPEMIEEKAPAAFQTQAHSSRSDRFTPIPTRPILRAAWDEGFRVVGVRQQRTADKSKVNFTKVRFSLMHIEDMKKPVRPGEFRRVDLVNSAAGEASLKAVAMWWRLVCANGMSNVTRDEVIRVRHTGFDGDITNIVEAIVEADNRAKMLGVETERWQRLHLPERVRDRFAVRAHQIRFGLPEDADEKSLEWNRLAPVAPTDLLEVRRREDAGDDLWHVFNRVQENCMRGGQLNDRQVMVGRRENRRISRSREIKGFEQQDLLNGRLWEVARKAAAFLN